MHQALLWRRDERGGIAINFAIGLVVLMTLVGSTLDYVEAVGQRKRLQAIVDTAALAAARELGLADSKSENIAAVVDAMVKNSMRSNADKRKQEPSIKTEVRNKPLEVAVTARQLTTSNFGNPFGLAPRELVANAVARIIGNPNICVLALDQSANGAISLEQDARVTGNRCAVFSNSTHTNSIRAKNSALLTASLICAAGGKDGGPGSFSPAPVTDCPTFDDPLKSRPEPVVGTCRSANPARITTSQTLGPGTYCGGLEIAGNAVVDLLPGIYIIKDGPLLVRDRSSIRGEGVGFFLTGTGAITKFERDTSIDLGAPKSGEMAGLLLFESRTQSTSAKHEILSDNARNLLGTLYLSRGQLHIDATKPVADKSAYTAVVARVMTLYGGPHLVLNSNYELSDVPVPDGIKGAAQPTRLVN